MGKRQFLKSIFSVLSLFVFVSALIAQSEQVLTNNEVISLIQAGVGKQIIINKIKNSKSNFDLSTEKLIELKKANVDDEIVLAMLEAKSGKVIENESLQKTASAKNTDPNDPMSPHHYGIYLFEMIEAGNKMTQLAPAVSAQNRKDGLVTSKLTHGIVKVKVKAGLPGTFANIQTNSPKPVFYFYLDSNSGGLNTASGIPSTTNEFVLVRFELRNNKREIIISESNPFLERGGVSDKYIVKFISEKVGDGIFKVTPETELKKGEYAFYLINSGNSNTTAGGGAKFFDFSIK